MQWGKCGKYVRPVGEPVVGNVRYVPFEGIWLSIGGAFATCGSVKNRS